MKNPLKKWIGPGTLVTAAFIGPGTVTVCTLAGVRSGYMLLWALLFSVIATLILQEMTGRLGIVSRRGFGEAIRGQLTNPVTRVAGILLVLSAIVVGNVAYEGGNISGAVLGWEEVFGSWNWTVGESGVGSAEVTGTADLTVRIPALLIGLIAFLLLYHGSFQRILFVMTALVGVMSLVFVTTAVMIGPDLSAVMKGLLIPRATSAEFLTVIALIGTTVVPYNLFLHASMVQGRYTDPIQLSDMRKENAAGILMGGLISIAIVITSATAETLTHQPVQNASDMARQLEPLLGGWAKSFMGIGLFAAGITSAVTAPLAAAYAARGLLGWEEKEKKAEMNGSEGVVEGAVENAVEVAAQSTTQTSSFENPRFRAVWMTVLGAGILFSSLSYNPVRLIEFAQVANGITLPVIAAFLLYIMNQPTLMGEYRNSLRGNVAGLAVILVTILISFRILRGVFL
ncbi:MAG: manganese transporter [Bacteroidetes bacterium]|nr:MAG: manganese transporter [Bacteroidota bacterium]